MKNGAKFWLISLLVMLFVLVGCIAAPPLVTDRNSTIAPISTGQSIEAGDDPSALTIIAGDVLGVCQSQIEMLLQDYSTKNFIYPHLTRRATLLQLRPEALRHSNYVEMTSSPIQLELEALAAADYFAQHQSEGVQGLQQWLQERNLLCSATSACPAIVGQNLDSDAATEYIFTVSSRPANCGDSMFSPTQQVYLLDCPSGTTNCYVRRIGRTDSELHSACVRAVADNNGDQFPELYVHAQFCGATHCWDDLEVVSSDETWFAPRYLVPTLSVRDGCIAEKDLDSDGHKELLILEDLLAGYGKDFDKDGRPWTGPLPDSLEIYTWNGAVYTLADRQYTKQCLYHYIVAGTEWAVGKEYERALAVFRSVATDPKIPEICADPPFDAGYPWRAFAQYAVGVLSARMNEPASAKDALAQVQSLDPEGVFTPLAELFLAAYQAENYTTACTAIDRYVETQPEAALFYGPFPQRKLLPFCP